MIYELFTTLSPGFSAPKKTNNDISRRNEMKVVAQSMQLLTMLIKDFWPSLQNVACSFSKTKNLHVKYSLL